jgi:hypothetical protein
MQASRTRSLRDPDWRAGPLPSRRLLFAATRSLAAALAVHDGAADAASLPAVVLGGSSRRGRCLEVVCVGACDVVAPLAAVAGRFGAELVVRYAASVDDPMVQDAVRHGAVVLAGSLRPAPGPDFAQAPA